MGLPQIHLHRLHGWLQCGNSVHRLHHRRAPHEHLPHQDCSVLCPPGLCHHKHAHHVHREGQWGHLSNQLCDDWSPPSRLYWSRCWQLEPGGNHPHLRFLRYSLRGHRNCSPHHSTADSRRQRDETQEARLASSYLFRGGWHLRGVFCGIHVFDSGQGVRPRHHAHPLRLRGHTVLLHCASEVQGRQSPRHRDYCSAHRNVLQVALVCHLRIRRVCVPGRAHHLPRAQVPVAHLGVHHPSR